MLTVSLVHKFCGQLVLNPFATVENPRFSAGSRPVPKFVAPLNRTANSRTDWKSEVATRQKVSHVPPARS